MARTNSPLVVMKPDRSIVSSVAQSCICSRLTCSDNNSFAEVSIHRLSLEDLSTTEDYVLSLEIIHEAFAVLIRNWDL